MFTPSCVAYVCLCVPQREVERETESERDRERDATQKGIERERERKINQSRREGGSLRTGQGVERGRVVPNWDVLAFFLSIVDAYCYAGSN